MANNATGTLSFQVQNPIPGGGPGTTFTESVEPNSIALTATGVDGVNTGYADMDVHRRHDGDGDWFAADGGELELDGQRGFDFQQRSLYSAGDDEPQCPSCPVSCDPGLKSCDYRLLLVGHYQWGPGHHRRQSGHRARRGDDDGHDYRDGLCSIYRRRGQWRSGAYDLCLAYLHRRLR